jgi:ubiquinone/menaquinone biosynthesis C-methylase UbiE
MSSIVTATPSSNINRGQVSSNAAEVYEAFFVRCLFQQWTDRMCDAALVTQGQCVLDVACGTGVLARTAAARVGSLGRVVGADINDGMLAVARRTSPSIEWCNSPAERLAFADGSFDAVVCQFGLMFFLDRSAAVAEMARVLRPGGRLALAVWDELASTPGYDAMTDLLQRLFGDRAADALREPFSLGAKAELARYFTDPRLGSVTITTHEGTAHFESIEDWVNINIKGWTLADMIDDAQVAELLQASHVEFRRFVQPDGSVVFPIPAHIVSAVRI